MAQQIASVDRYIQAFDALSRDGFARDPSWLQDLRKAALLKFGEMGFPTARRGNEEWKYTNVGPLSRVPFRPLPSSTPAPIERGDMERFAFGEPQWPRLVFVDGAYAEALSSVASLPAGVSVLSLVEAMAAQGPLLERHLARYAAYETRAFTALNTAFLRDGALVHIPDGVVVEAPIHLLFLFTTGEPDLASHPRVLILTGKGSQATVVESYGGLGEGRYLSNAVTEIAVGPGSVVKHYKVQRHSEQAYHIGATDVALSRDASFTSVSVDLGGGLVRNDLNVLMGDEGASCVLNGIYLVTRSQHVDNQVIVDHAKPYTTTREVYKGVLGGKARSVFHGSIIVREGARKVDARQEDRNLLLSPHAEADTKPAFWIYCDDVKCAHGATCGQINEDALFYLGSRGIGEEEARNMLTRAFVVEVINSIGSEPLRTRIDELAMAKLKELW